MVQHDALQQIWGSAPPSIMTEVFGQQSLQGAGSDYNSLVFVFQQLINKLATVALVQVKAVTNAGGVSPVGTVDVQPLVNQLTGQGVPYPHGTIYKVPYFRLQGGANAVILDPQVGDLGMCAFCSRDISAAKTAKGVANPGSYRTFDWADGLYLGGFLNGTPTQYVQFTAGGIQLTSPTKVKITAPAIELDGPVTATSSIVATGDVTGNGTSLHTHVHSGVQSGGSNSGPPV